MSDRCPTCDRPTAYDECGVYRNALYYADGACAGGTGSSDCEANRVDWRARALLNWELYDSLRTLRECDRVTQQQARELLIEDRDKARDERDRLRAFVEMVAQLRLFGLFGEHEDKQAELRQQAQRVLRGEE